MIEVFIESQYITLGQFLKKMNFISSGGQAKFFLLEAAVFVNDEKENRRGRKLYPGDIITLENQSFKLCD